MLHIVTTTLLALSLTALPQQDPMQTRGAQAMGFDQDKTTHHFLLFEDGGAIDISVKDPTDAANLDAIRSHLHPEKLIMTAAGDFEG